MVVMDGKSSRGMLNLAIGKYMASRDLVMYVFGDLMSNGTVNTVRLVTVHQGFTYVFDLKAFKQ